MTEDEPDPPAGRVPSRAHRTPPTVEIGAERELVTQRKAIAARLSANPEAMRMLVLNPVLALRDAGVNLSPAVANHVLHALQYPPEVRAERDQLEAELKAALGKAPRPADPAWLAATVFVQLGVVPRQTAGRQPVYSSAIDADSLQRLRALLPTRGVRTLPAGGDAPPQVDRQPFEPMALELLDLDAPVPDLTPADEAPRELSLTELWFYKDAQAPIKPLLRLGILINSGVAFVSSAQYRKIRDGQANHDLVSWISAVQIPAQPGHATGQGGT